RPLVADNLVNLFSNILLYALFEAGFETEFFSGWGSFTHIKALQRDATLNQAGLKHIEDGEDAIFAIRLHQDFVTAPGDAGISALEVIALLDFFYRLVKGVIGLLAVYFTYDIKRGISHDPIVAH